jgi:hypothetical protein
VLRGRLRVRLPLAAFAVSIGLVTFACGGNSDTEALEGRVAELEAQLATTTAATTTTTVTATTPPSATSAPTTAATTTTTTAVPPTQIGVTKFVVAALEIHHFEPASLTAVTSQFAIRMVGDLSFVIQAFQSHEEAHFEAVVIASKALVVINDANNNGLDGVIFSDGPRLYLTSRSLVSEYESATDWGTMQFLAAGSIGFDEWVKAAGATFVD